MLGETSTLAIGDCSTKFRLTAFGQQQFYVRAADKWNSMSTNIIECKTLMVPVKKQTNKKTYTKLN